MAKWKERKVARETKKKEGEMGFIVSVGFPKELGRNGKGLV